MSTRLVGAIIMTHGDDDGLILPPAIAPIQVVIVPVAAHKPGVSEKAAELAEQPQQVLPASSWTTATTPRAGSSAQWEMKGVPLRLEIGPKDLEKNQCVLVRRDTREKTFVSLDELETAIPAQLEALRTGVCTSVPSRTARSVPGPPPPWTRSRSWPRPTPATSRPCGAATSPARMKMKEEAGLSSRCMPFEQEHLSDVCPCCGKPAKTMVYWGVAY